MLMEKRAAIVLDVPWTTAATAEIFPKTNRENMATIRKEILTTAHPDAVWDAIRAVDSLHTRLVPGFVKDTKMEGNVRVVTFFNGMVVKEPIISIDERHRRLAWAAAGGQLSHYNASVQVFDGENGGSRILWIADLLPNEAEGTIRSMIDLGAAAMKKKLDVTK